jgi:prepilin-type N-terminal cleavage/methylation domain-containing protein
MKKGFTLIELMIVVILIGVTYSVYFFTGAKHTSKEAQKFSIQEISNFVAKDQMLLCSRDKELCYLLNKNRELIRTYPFTQELTQYTLAADETLHLAYYNAIELEDSIYFTPSLLYKKNAHGVGSVLIYYDEAKMHWAYMSPYTNKYAIFKNQENLLRFITKKEYLPRNGGLAE